MGADAASSYTNKMWFLCPLYPQLRSLVSQAVSKQIRQHPKGASGVIWTLLGTPRAPERISQDYAKSVQTLVSRITDLFWHPLSSLDKTLGPHAWKSLGPLNRFASLSPWGPGRPTKGPRNKCTEFVHLFWSPKWLGPQIFLLCKLR